MKGFKIKEAWLKNRAMEISNFIRVWNVKYQKIE